ncbi:hypothetical protein [uncultured Sneathiella sp.]|jgi:hypothetical protein|uniref:hypothetical protein n=1 Tax=uncultured Sneathiella sp. TaxID=879315 RepID=UPI0030DAB069|tara:strand:+ start:15023 stop:15745 length:723 start_codon:yes stop_codon:yes gene_type:complete
MTIPHPYWTNYGHYPPTAPDANPHNPLNLPDRYFPTLGHPGYHPGNHHPAHPYMGPPHYPALAPQHPVHPHYPPLVDHVTHAGPGHDIYSYPHPYQRFEQHPAAAHHHPVTTHHVQHHHYHHTHNHRHLHQGLTLHIRMITVSEDITKVHWIWHVTDDGGTLVKSTTKIHETFEECIADIAGHAEVKILAEHEDYTKKSWVWQISDHTGHVIKTSAVIHKTIDKCIADVRHHGASLTSAA